MSETSVLAELFTSSHLQRLAWHGSSEVVSASLEIMRRRSHAPLGTLGDLIEGAFDVLRREYPIEYVYKAYVLKRTVFGMYSPNTTAFYTEFPVADARADVLLVNGNATVVEIKTKYDDASRLGCQLRDYFKCFTRVVVLTDPSWADEYASTLPQHVGVSVLNSRTYFTELRPPADFVYDLRQADIYQLFRQGERRRISKELGTDLTDVDPAEEYMVGLECLSRQTTECLHGRLVDTLRERQRTARLADLCGRLPPSLHAGAFGYRLRIRDWEDLIGVLAAPLSI